MGVLNTRADKYDFTPIIMRKIDVGEDGLKLLDKWGFFYRERGMDIEGASMVEIYHPEAS